jgi:hypothetical protein
MKSLQLFLAWSFCAVALSPSLPAVAEAPDRAAPARLIPASPSGFSDSERDAFVARILSRPEVRALTAGRRTRLLRVWTDAEKRGADVQRRGVVLVRDYDAGVAREFTSDLAGGPVTIRELFNVQPSDEEIEEAMAIARRDPVLRPFSSDPNLRLIGGFHNRSPVRDDACARNVCLELAFMRPGYQGPARYVVVDLSRGVVSHHDFRGSRKGEPARMTEPKP